MILALTPGSTVIVCSTISPSDAERLDALAQKHGLSLVDAPISGGPTKAAAGDLSVMASGSDAALSSALPVLQAMAKETKKLHLIRELYRREYMLILFQLVALALGASSSSSTTSLLEYTFVQPPRLRLWPKRRR